MVCFAIRRAGRRNAVAWLVLAAAAWLPSAWAAGVGGAARLWRGTLAPAAPRRSTPAPDRRGADEWCAGWPASTSGTGARRASLAPTRRRSCGRRRGGPFGRHLCPGGWVSPIGRARVLPAWPGAASARARTRSACVARGVERAASRPCVDLSATCGGSYRRVGPPDRRRFRGLPAWCPGARRWLFHWQRRRLSTGPVGSAGTGSRATHGPRPGRESVGRPHAGRLPPVPPERGAPPMLLAPLAFPQRDGHLQLLLAGLRSGHLTDRRGGCPKFVR
jgi:hypothetical protein